MTQEEHSAAVQKGKGHIKAGDIYQIVLSVRFSGRTDLGSVPGLPRLAPAGILRPTCITLGSRRAPSRGLFARGARAALGRTASLRPIAGGKRRAGSRPSTTRRSKPSCSRIRRRTPSM